MAIIMRIFHFPYLFSQEILTIGLDLINIKLVKLYYPFHKYTLLTSQYSPTFVDIGGQIWYIMSICRRES